MVNGMGAGNICDKLQGEIVASSLCVCTYICVCSRQVDIGRQNERQSWPSGTTQNATTTTKQATKKKQHKERTLARESRRELKTTEREAERGALSLFTHATNGI